VQASVHDKNQQRTEQQSDSLSNQTTLLKKHHQLQRICLKAMVQQTMSQPVRYTTFQMNTHTDKP
jgi:hypothetical protein